ncbi:MAG TPA: hypothetical protein VFY51_03480 [Pyrinomonadaceae bacterium]|nr:hypothetical protein [Pyrinomonadaceae bacterium]
MKFIEVPHPEGGTLLINADHITAAHYRPGEGDVKTRLGLDLDERQNDIVLFGEDAERTWQRLHDLGKTSA